MHAGRLALRVAWGMPEAYNIVALNDIAAEESIAYLIKYDSIHGTWGPSVEYDAPGKQVIITDGDRVAKVAITREADPAKVPLPPQNRVDAQLLVFAWSSPGRSFCIRTNQATDFSSIEAQSITVCTSSVGSPGAWHPPTLPRWWCLQLDYSGMDVKVVMESTGVHLTSAKLQPYFDKGVLKVVVSAPVKDGNENTINLVVGCNDVRSPSSSAAIPPPPTSPITACHAQPPTRRLATLRVPHSTRTGSIPPHGA